MCQRLGFIHGLLTWTRKFTTGRFGWFMVFNATFNNLSVITYIVVVRFIGGGNSSTWRKTTDLLQVTDKLYPIMLYQVHLVLVRLKLTTLKFTTHPPRPKLYDHSVSFLVCL